MSEPLPAASLATAIIAAVDEAFEREQVPFVRRLVDQPSFTGARDDVEAAALIIDACAESLDLRCRRVPDPSGVYADHRVYTTEVTAADTPSLALVGHVDTVFPRNTGFLRFVR